MIGLLYLENTLTSHAFTPDRIAVLELLASQAAISLENARLYSELQERGAVRRLFDSTSAGFTWDFRRAIWIRTSLSEMIGFRGENSSGSPVSPAD